MKIYKKILSIALISSLVIGMSLSSSFAAEAEQDVQAISTERIQVEQDSIEAYENILDTFKSSNNEMQYDESYAGAYLNDDGKLVVLIAAPDVESAALELKESAGLESKTSAIKTNKNARTNANVDIIFEKAKYSYAYLTGLMEQLNAEYKEKHYDPDSIWSQVSFFAIYDDQNCISVGILDIDDLKIERFKSEVNNSQAIKFEEAEEFMNADATMKAGGDLNNSDGATGSIGYKAYLYRNGSYEYGFVTAAHLANKVGEYLMSNPSTYVGDCTAIHRNTDSAFIKLQPGVTMSKVTTFGTTISGWSSPLVNKTVYKEGTSTGKTSGTISSISGTAYIEGYYVSNLILSNYSCAGGDSGGIVYDSSKYVLGIHVGHSGSKTAAVDASAIQRNLGAIPDYN